MGEAKRRKNPDGSYKHYKGKDYIKRQSPSRSWIRTVRILEKFNPELLKKLFMGSRRK